MYSSFLLFREGIYPENTLNHLAMSGFVTAFLLLVLFVDVALW